ncbi:hypothetical protein [Puia dinghuensis]|uniref:Uncharacterized protein n=1 Tax=Puia dinghuensis TaxID=1792502 RepID=A0A8J2XT77_9BACT|nr:hypothetical protein [Puia dinghuensis]GGB01831.1 hypothetical protein GCM10011511_26300 [Puia dinghuensis]
MRNVVSVLTKKEGAIMAALDELADIIVLPERKHLEQIETALACLQTYPNRQWAYTPATRGNGRREWAAGCYVTIATEILILSILERSDKPDAAYKARQYLGNALQEIQTLFNYK